MSVVAFVILVALVVWSIGHLIPGARAAFAPEPVAVEVPVFVANPNRVRL